MEGKVLGISGGVVGSQVQADCIPTGSVFFCSYTSAIKNGPHVRECKVSGLGLLQ